MKVQHVQIDKHGRLLVPSQIRNIMNYKAGDSFVVKAINNELHFISLNQALSTAQELFKSKSQNSSFSTDEFLEVKYNEAHNENSENYK